MLGFFFPFLYTIFFGYSVVYDPPLNPAEFYSMSHEQQQEWLSSHSKTLSGFQTILSRFGEESFWDDYTQVFGISFFMLLVACLSFGFWERRISRSNPALNPDAQKQRAG